MTEQTGKGGDPEHQVPGPTVPGMTRSVAMEQPYPSSGLSLSSSQMGPSVLLFWWGRGLGWLSGDGDICFYKGQGFVLRGCILIPPQEVERRGEHSGPRRSLHRASLSTSGSGGPYLLAGGGGRGPPRDLSRVPQKLAELLEVLFQLAHVHRGIVGSLLGRIWNRGQTEAVNHEPDAGHPSYSCLTLW